MVVKLIRHTPDPDGVCAQAAALCTGWTGDPLKALRGALNKGHESVAEHAYFTFKIEDVSRSLLAQLTRHRIASFSVQSQRYCGITHAVVIPDSVRGASRDVQEVFAKSIKTSHEAYDYLVASGVPAEDARMVAPEGETTNLIMSMNGRELRHFFGLRTCNRAQWEIRALADIMLEECYCVAPELFRKCGCACMQGKPCPEGKMSCGKPRKKVGA